MTIELMIRRHPDGKVEVSGPLQDKVLCYGLLGVARDSIAAYDVTKMIKPAVLIPVPRNGG